MTPTKAQPVVSETTGGNGHGRANNLAYSSTAQPRTQAPNANLAHAVRYALAGWQVLPLVAGGKAPLTEHGVKDASSDPEAIGAWWQRWPAANIGLALGDDLVCFDVDPRNGGTLDALLKLGLDPSETVTQRTAGGGWHVLYAKPHGWALAGKLPNVPGIDVLSAGRYIVAAPSTVNGKPYVWERDPLDVDPARIPLELAERLRKHTPAARPAAQDGAEQHRTAQPGQYGLDDLRAMLAVLDPWQFDYSGWLACLMACHAGFGDDALPIVEDWADGKHGEVARKWADFDAAGGVTVATLVYHARAAGWVPPVPDSDIPERWRITADDWRTCPLCAAHHTARMDDNSASDYHRWCRKPSCKVYRKRKIHVALRCVFSWRGVGTETVPAAQFRTWRRRANLRYGSNGWRAIPDGDTHLALFDTETPTEALDDVLERALALMLANDATRRERRKARKFLLTLPADEALDPVTLERMKEALDLLAIGKPVNLSTPRKARNTDGSALEQPVKPPRPKPVETILVSKHYHSRAVKDVLNRLQIPWERRPYGGWRTEPLSDMQWMQLRTALAFAVPGAMVTAALAVGSYALLGQSWPEDLPHSEREAVLYALRNRVNLEQSLPLRR